MIAVPDQLTCTLTSCDFHEFTLYQNCTYTNVNCRLMDRSETYLSAFFERGFERGNPLEQFKVSDSNNNSSINSKCYYNCTYLVQGNSI